MKRLLPEVSIFLVGAVLVFTVVHTGVPWLASLGVDRFGAWMLLAIPFVLGPVIGLGLWRHRQAPRPLRFVRPGRRDWAWAAAGAGGIVVGSLATKGVADALGLSIDPFHRDPHPWAGWMFALWAIYWPLNILGEEFVWRGVVLPRMELELGANAWLLNAALWMVFHTGFGPGNILTLVPTLLIVPFVAQKTRNTWLAVFLHAFVSLPGMAMIALGKI